MDALSKLNIRLELGGRLTELEVEVGWSDRQADESQYEAPRLIRLEVLKVFSFIFFLFLKAETYIAYPDISKVCSPLREQDVLCMLWVANEDEKQGSRRAVSYEKPYLSARFIIIRTLINDLY